MTVNVIIVVEEFECQELFDSYFHDELSLKVIDKVEIIDENTIAINGENIFFDYLIIGDYQNISGLNKLKIVSENGFPLTNYSLQTSIYNVFAIAPYANCKRNIFDQFDIIFDYIKNPY